jgi:hypothetical protein
MMGFDATTLKLKYVYNDTPDGSDGGIWMASNGPSVDDSGYIYIVAGNGTVGIGDTIPNNTRGRGESIMKFKPTADSLRLVDYFTPANYKYLEQNDLDYGIGGAMLIPNSTLSVTNSKEGKIFLLDDNKLGKYTPNNDSVLQSITVVHALGPYDWYNFGTPVYYHFFSQADSEFVYVWAATDTIKQLYFDRSNGIFDLSKTIKGEKIAYSSTSPYGPVITVSSDSTIAGTGIVWALQQASGNENTEVLDAYDARDVRKHLWGSNVAPLTNSLGIWAKFNTPVIANGKVYVPSQSNKIYVYGLHNNISTGIGIENVNPKFSLFPNPAGEFVTLKYSLTRPENGLKAGLFDLYGRQVLNFPLNGTKGENSQVLNFNNQLSTGVYTLIISSGENLYCVTKLVKY